MNLQWLRSATSVFSSNLEVLDSKIVDHSVPTMEEKGGSEEGGGVKGLCDTKMSDFRYKQYPQKISGYVTGSHNTY